MTIVVDFPHVFIKVSVGEKYQEKILFKLLATFIAFGIHSKKEQIKNKSTTEEGPHNKGI